LLLTIIFTDGEQGLRSINIQMDEGNSTETVAEKDKEGNVFKE
jgi:hypothetical protein